MRALCRKWDEKSKELVLLVLMNEGIHKCGKEMTLDLEGLEFW